MCVDTKVKILIAFAKNTVKKRPIFTDKAQNLKI